MIEELRKRLNGNRLRLVEDLDISVIFLTVLLEKESIKQEDKEEIQALPTDEQKVDKLLDILEKSQESCWYNFLECLKIQRPDLYDLIIGDTTPPSVVDPPGRTTPPIEPTKLTDSPTPSPPIEPDPDIDSSILIESSPGFIPKGHQQPPAQLSEIHAAIIAGKAVIKSVEGLYEKAISVSDIRYNDNATNFKRRFRSLELAIINGCSKELRFSKEYFNTGTWFVAAAPKILKPGEVSIVFVANREYVPSGVTGSLVYSIENTDGLHLHIGFTNPLLGSYKNVIQVNKIKKAEWGYENSKDDSFKNPPSDRYSFDVTCTIRDPEISPFKMFEYTITENPTHSTRTIEPSPRPDPSVNPGRKYFYIRTGLPGSDMVLGTDDNECQPGAKIVLRKPARGTLWYQNEDDEYICSKEGNDLVFDGEGQEFHLNPYTKHNKRKCWVIIDNYIVNHFDHNEVVTLKTANNAGGTEIWRQPRNGDKTQQWYFDYKD